MKYFRVFDGDKREISYLQALRIVTGRFRDCQMVRDMLTIPNRIPGIASYVLVVDENKPNMVPMAGLECLVPHGYEYDEKGDRIDNN